MVADIPLVAVTAGSMAFSRPPLAAGIFTLSRPTVLGESYDFQLETEVLKRMNC
jgi:hypothetical protein